jgi:hypothetical protein
MADPWDNFILRYRDVLMMKSFRDVLKAHYYYVNKDLKKADNTMGVVMTELKDNI